LAALSALFQTPSAAIESDVELPTNLDASILSDACTACDAASYRWYRGTDQAGVQRIFRFLRAGSLELWHESLHSQRLQSVAGPFRTQAHAQARAA
jgi:hypothetical protein